MILQKFIDLIFEQNMFHILIFPEITIKLAVDFNYCKCYSDINIK